METHSKGKLYNRIAEIAKPAITQAEQGIKVNWSMAQYIDENVDNMKHYA